MNTPLPMPVLSTNKGDCRRCKGTGIFVGNKGFALGKCFSCGGTGDAPDFGTWNAKRWAADASRTIAATPTTSGPWIDAHMQGAFGPFEPGAAVQARRWLTNHNCEVWEVASPAGCAYWTRAEVTIRLRRAVSVAA